VTFDNYSTRYRPELDLVLNVVSFDVRGGEKVDLYCVFLFVSIQPFCILFFVRDNLA